MPLCNEFTFDILGGGSVCGSGRGVRSSRYRGWRVRLMGAPFLIHVTDEVPTACGGTRALHGRGTVWGAGSPAPLAYGSASITASPSRGDGVSTISGKGYCWGWALGDAAAGVPDNWLLTTAHIITFKWWDWIARKNVQNEEVYCNKRSEPHKLLP